MLANVNVVLHEWNTILFKLDESQTSYYLVEQRYWSRNWQGRAQLSFICGCNRCKHIDLILKLILKTVYMVKDAIIIIFSRINFQFSTNTAFHVRNTTGNTVWWKMRQVIFVRLEEKKRTKTLFNEDFSSKLRCLRIMFIK
jgi:hypothetical protein